MAQAPDWKQLIEAGMQFTELRRSQAKKIAADLLAQGQIARDQVASTVDELVDLSRRRREEVSTIVRHELQRQLGVLGVATKDDLARLERRIAALPAPAAAKRAPAKKAAAKKATGARKAVGATKAASATKATAKTVTATKGTRTARVAATATKTSTGAGRTAAGGF
jgi:polyhydroxyalkanoate synthesis regulator phasin